MLKDIMYATNHQKVLAFLLLHPGEEFYDRQMSRLTGVSRAGTNFALRGLVKAGIALREKRGRMYFYTVDAKDGFIQHLKIVQNITFLYPLIKKLRNVSLRLVLYGSASKGENLNDSDLDLFILSRNPQEAKAIIYKSQLTEKIQYVVNTPNEFAKLKKQNPVFYGEISAGISLWEKV